MAGRLDHAVAAQISSRLAVLEDLRLPGQLTRNGCPTLEIKERYLLSLLERDPGVFLERHGEMLLADELRQFEPLRDDYEVDLYLKMLEDTQDPAKLETQSRNRRVAYMHKLINEGSYFSTEEMQQRQPWLYHEFVGRYKDKQEEQAVPGEPYSEWLIRRGRLETVAKAMEAQRAAAVEGGSLTDDVDEETSTSAPADDTEDQRQQMFLDMMQQRFLAGEDPGVDYASIDQDTELDEYWAALQAQDAEDAYFDS